MSKEDTRKPLDVSGLTDGTRRFDVLAAEMSIAEHFDAANVPEFLRAATIAHHEAGPSPWFPQGHERDLTKQITAADFDAALNAASNVRVA